ncbi:MAG: NAD(P)/FAD-dependent oxidoreductase [Granulosicoccus sp.]
MSKDSSRSRHCVVVGAGIVGVATGIWLARSGVKVTLIDRQAPGEGTSHGNAGVLASCSMVPVTTPGLARKAPALLLNKNSPLFMRWSYLPRIAPWLRRYLGYANDADTQRIAKHLAFIVGDSVEQHQDLAGNTAADQWLHPSDYQFAYRTMADFKADAYVWELRRKHGFEPELLTGHQVREKEPALGPDIDVLAVLKNHGHIGSPGLYVKSLATVFESLGGTILQGSVRDFTMTGGRVSAVITDAGPIACDSAVVATGVWSRPLCERFGLKIPLESERGYHVIFRNPSVKLTAPTMIASGKFVATPMHDGMRCAGIVELGGLHAGPSSEPIDLLMRQVKRTFPDLRYTDTVQWMGHRPAPADSLPFAGEIGQTGVYTAFGHHHVGLTGGPKTGRLIAELISGERTSADLAAYRPDRFS